MDAALKERPARRADEPAPAPGPKAERFVTVEGSALAKAMSVMLSVVERRNTYPILGTVRLAIAGAELRVTGTDLDISVTATLDVIDAGGDWSLCVDARLLAGIARASGVMTMRMSPQDDRLKVAVGDGDAAYEIDAMVADNYPTMAGETGDLIERFGNGQLAEILSKVAAFISTEETRYYLNGVAWQITGDSRRMAATDGHRLAICKYQSGVFVAPLQERIIPRKTVNVMRRHLAGADVACTPLSVNTRAQRLSRPPSWISWRRA